MSGSPLDTGGTPLPVKRFGASLRLVTLSLEWLGVGLMVTLTLLVLSNALGRYIFNKPLPWTEEIVLVLLTWQMAVGVLLAGMRQSLITCSMLLDRIGDGKKRRVALGVSLLGAGVMAYFSVLSWQYLQAFGGDVTPILKIPKASLILPLFCATLGLSLILFAQIFARREDN